MKVFKTNYGKGVYMSDTELIALGFIAVNILGETGIPFLDEYAKKTSPTLLSEDQLMVLHELYEAIKEEVQNG